MLHQHRHTNSYEKKTVHLFAVVSFSHIKQTPFSNFLSIVFAHNFIGQAGARKKKRLKTCEIHIFLLWVCPSRLHTGALPPPPLFSHPIYPSTVLYIRFRSIKRDKMLPGYERHNFIIHHLNTHANIYVEKPHRDSADASAHIHSRAFAIAKRKKNIWQRHIQLDAWIEGRMENHSSSRSRSS